MSYLNLDQATKMINNFLDNPTKEQPRLLNKAIDVWCVEYGQYISSIDDTTPSRIKMNIKRLFQMHTKALGIIFAMKGTSTILSDLIPHANGDTFANANKLIVVTNQMLTYLYYLPVKPGTI